MASRRKKTIRIHAVEQLQALASPTAIEILEALQTRGAATVAELGPGLGRKANSLHYHIRKLARVGLVRKVGARRSGARTQAVYDVPASRLTAQTVSKNAQLRKLTTEAVAALLRLTARNFARACEDPAAVETGKARNILANRHKAWLTRKELAKVNGHVDELRKIFAANSGTGRGRLCALTIVLTPLDQDRSLK
ncbi:MAG: helix-turn-helix domain-containing protein [Planctomycetota bacterium]